MGNILKLVIQHESPVSSLFLETGMICPHKSAFLVGTISWEVISGMAQALSSSWSSHIC